MKMARKPKERIIFDWMESHRAKIGDEVFNRVMEILRVENPGAIEPSRPRGKPRATNGPENIISDYWMNQLDDYSLLTDVFSLFGDRGKDLARLAICLMEIGLIRSENDAKKRFSEPTKAIYNLIREYKDFKRQPISYELFQREIKDIAEIETAYPEKEREEDKKMILDAMESVKDQYEDYYQYLLTERGWGDKDY